MSSVPLRHLAEINPPSPLFDQIPQDADVLFLPLETVWSDTRADLTRRQPKTMVANGYVRFEPHDVVCPKVTPTFQAARAMIVPEVGAGSTELHVLRPRGGVDPRWVAYAVRSNHFLDEGVTAFQGVAGLQRVPAAFVASFRVADKSEDEQRRIADFLDDRVARIDQIIAARQQQIHIIDEARISMFSQTIETLPRVPMRYLVSRMLVGIVVTPAKFYSEAPDAIPALRGINVNEATISFENLVKITPAGNLENRRSILSAGDLVIVRTGDAGAAAVVPESCDGWNCIDLVVARPAPHVEADFLEVMLNGARRADAISAASTGSIQQHFGVGAIAAFPIPFVQNSQRSITKELQGQRSQAWDQQARLQNSINLLQEYKQSLITAAVTGEFDVTTASTRIPE